MELEKFSHANGAASAKLVSESDSPQGVLLVNSRKTHKNNDPMDLVHIAQSIQTANEFVTANASNKLNVIAEQMRFLQAQARQILEDTRTDAELHAVSCNMVKKPGTVYYLYEKPSGERYLSMLSPQEWGQLCPKVFLGGFRLEYDRSWTPIEQISRKDSQNSQTNKMLTQAVNDAQFLDRN